MRKQDEYTLRTMMTHQDEILHIEVRSKKIKEQVYSKHYKKQDLPLDIQFVFQKIAKLYLFMQNPEVIYFDFDDMAVNFCINIANQRKYFFLPVECDNVDMILKLKTLQYEKQKALINDQYEKLKQIKQNELQMISQELEYQQSERQRAEFEKQIILQKLQKLNRDCSYLRQSIRLITEDIQVIDPTIIQQRILQPEELKQLEKKKAKWIKEVSLSSKAKLKSILHSATNFQERRNLTINNIQLKLMSFVQVFVNLTVLNLSLNKIKFMQGLESLRNLVDLDLSENHIEVIDGLENQKILKSLILYTNKIKKMENIFHLSNLQILSLSMNELQEVPYTIQQLIKLVEVRLINNRIKNISEKVLSLKNLRVFSTIGNMCYNDKNKSKEIINRLLFNDINTTKTLP